MSKSDYYRPADYQVTIIYECNSCAAKTEQISTYDVCECSCGGKFRMIGESYPASAEDWDEERDDTNSDWHRRRG